MPYRVHRAARPATTSFALAAAAGSLLAGAAAPGAFLGLEVRSGGACDGGGGCWGGSYSEWIENGYAGLATFRVYAVFDGAGDDGVLAVFGAPGAPLRLESGGGTFHNDRVFGGNTAPTDFRPAMVWSAEWDTYVSVGRTHAPDATALSPGFETLTDDLGVNWSSEQHRWSVSADEPQSRADAEGRVLLAQLTVPESDGVRGVVNLRLRDGGEALQVPFSGGACPADVSGDGVVDVADVLLVLAAWGPCEPCPQDVDGSGVVDVADVLVMLAAWGAC